MSGNKERNIQYPECICVTDDKFKFWRAETCEGDIVLYVNSPKYISFQDSDRLERINITEYFNHTRLENTVNKIDVFVCYNCNEGVRRIDSNWEHLIAYIRHYWDKRSFGI